MSIGGHGSGCKQLVMMALLGFYSEWSAATSLENGGRERSRNRNFSSFNFFETSSQWHCPMLWKEGEKNEEGELRLILGSGGSLTPISGRYDCGFQKANSSNFTRLRPQFLNG